MSSSNSAGSAKWTGKVLIGGGGDRLSETTVQELEGQRKMAAWNSATEAEYMDRVRARATAKAQEILTAAQAEAAQLKQQAAEQGYAEGIQQAQAELDHAKGEYGGAVAQVLEMIQSSGRAVFERYRQDLVVLVRLATEKVIGTEISWRREEILSSLLEQSLEHLDSRVGLRITVNPVDEPLLQEMLELARQQHPGLDRWRVKGDESMTPGGVIVESDHGMVDNTLEGRQAVISEIFEQLTLPLDGETPPSPASGEPRAPAGEQAASPRAAATTAAAPQAPSAPAEPGTAAGPQKVEPVAPSQTGFPEITHEAMQRCMGLGMAPEFVQHAAMQGIPPETLAEAVSAGIPAEEAVSLILEAMAGAASPDPLDAPDAE